jgi:hypothetical protein
MGNTPPTITFSPGPSVQGPLSNGPPKTPPLVLTWSLFRGPAPVAFSRAKPALPNFEAPEKNGVKTTAKTTATFTEPGQYILLVVANDWSGEGGRGFQCCWTTGRVKVNVKGAN